MTFCVKVDIDVCQAHGECTRVAPDLFRLNSNFELDWEQHPPESRRQAVEDAVAACPVRAISVIRLETPELL